MRGVTEARSKAADAIRAMGEDRAIDWIGRTIELGGELMTQVGDHRDDCPPDVVDAAEVFASHVCSLEEWMPQ